MRLLAVVVACSILAACGGGGSSSSLPAVTAAQEPASAGRKPALLGGGKIKHVIIVIMENRTFDNLFNGYPGADTVQSGLTHTGASVPLLPSPFEQPCDPDHSHGAW